jgi:tRNA (guanine37-N1)-methyltransferase
MPKVTQCIKVPKNQGQKTLALTIKLELFDKSLEIQRDESSLCIPVVRQPNESELAMLTSEVPQIQLKIKVFVEKPVQAETLVQALKGDLPSRLLSSLPQALNIIGDIVIIEVPSELKPYEKLLGEAILETHKNVKTVLAKAGAINGTYRVREFTFLAGELKTQTVHKEYGCQYNVDVAKAYFSPRLSHEHERVASFVKSGETVVDLFAGVGPFSILIAKKNPQVKVCAVDINPEAVDLLKFNVRVNRVENRVFPILGDAKQIAAEKLHAIADRAIMNLPETAIEFVDAACQAIKPEGGMIHFYAFVRQPDTIENLKQRFGQAVRVAGRKVEAFHYAKNIRETAPYESQVVLDVKIA